MDDAVTLSVEDCPTVCSDAAGGIFSHKAQLARYYGQLLEFVVQSTSQVHYASFPHTIAPTKIDQVVVMLDRKSTAPANS